MRHFFLVLALAVVNLVRAGESAAGPGEHERRAVIFYTAETHGTLEPCGCTSDPLGDFARVTALVRAAAGRDRSALLVDAGNLAYAATETSKREQPAAQLRAEFLAREIVKVPFGGGALGDSDLASGPGGVAPKRLAVNLASEPFVEPSRIATVGSIKIGVLGVADPDLAAKAGLSAQDPATVAQQEIARLRAAGAEVIVLLAPVERQLARNLARTTGADFVVVGKHVGQGMARAEAVGTAYVVAPAEELQRVGRLEIVLRGKGPRACPRAAGRCGRRRPGQGSALPSSTTRSREWTPTSCAGRRKPVRIPRSWRRSCANATSCAPSVRNLATADGKRRPRARTSRILWFQFGARCRAIQLCRPACTSSIARSARPIYAWPSRLSLRSPDEHPTWAARNASRATSPPPAFGSTRSTPRPGRPWSTSARKPTTTA